MPFRKRSEEELERDQAPQSFFCVICGTSIPEERIRRKAVTCSKQHAIDFKNAKRRLRDADRCRLCKRPSTSTERALFDAWRRAQAKEESEKKKAATKARRAEKRKKKAEEAKAQKAIEPTPIEEHLGTMQI